MKLLTKLYVSIRVDVAMATLLHFLSSLAISLLTGFMLSLSALVGTLSGLTIAKASVVGAIATPICHWMQAFLAVFGGGRCWDGAIAISCTVGIVSALWHTFSAYKHKQKNIWQLTAAGAFRPNT